MRQNAHYSNTPLLFPDGGIGQFEAICGNRLVSGNRLAGLAELSVLSGKAKLEHS